MELNKYQNNKHMLHSNGTIYSTNSGIINTPTTNNPDYFTLHPNIYNPNIYNSLTINSPTTNPINMNKIQQTKVAVFKVIRNEENEIINAEFIKEMWIQTKAGISVEFEVGRDKDLIEYDSSELVIKQITSIIF